MELTVLVPEPFSVFILEGQARWITYQTTLCHGILNQAPKHELRSEIDTI